MSARVEAAAVPAGRRIAARSLPILALALLCGAAGLGLAYHHPLAPRAAPLLFVLAAAAFGRWPSAWPTVLPALLPVIGLAPWTGWITFEEWDLLVLAVAAGGYTQHAFRRSPARQSTASYGMSALVALVLTLYAAAMAVSAVRGVADAGGFAFDLFQGYREPMNSLRLAKSLFAALLLYPLWAAAMRADPARSTRQLVNGLALGLLATAVAATWERIAFTGLLNFSTDYRTTALFWEMHVGGAALDGMLALTFAFVLRELLVPNPPHRWIGMALVLAVAAYACITTFSRSVYLAVPIGVALMLVVQARQTQRAQPLREWVIVAVPAAVLAAAFACGAALMFPTSGYRGVIALLGVSSLLLALPTVLRDGPRSVLWSGLGLGLALCGLAWTSTLILPKSAYFTYAILALAALATLVWQRRKPARLPDAPVDTRVPTLALACYLALLTCTLLVADTWGGSAALQAAWPVVAALPLLLLAALTARSPLWPTAWRWQVGAAGLLLLAAGMVAAFSGGAYMSGRFSTASEDVQGRIEHWRQGLSGLHDGLDWTFGRGLGRFVDEHAFAAPVNQKPGDYRLRQEGDNRFVTLVAGTHVLGWGELLRLSQRIAAPEAPTFVRMQVRSEQAAVIHVEVCFKHLLYDGGCMVKQLRLPAKPGQWQDARVQFDRELRSPGPWYAPKLVMFSIASESQGVRVDIDNIELVDGSERNRLVNGSFQADLSRWFMTSDRNHMPWHMKNIAAHVLFDQGLVGLLLLGALTGGALFRMALGSGRSHALAPGVAGGLAGFLVVGMFDSLLDVPRVAFLFYFLLLLGLTLKAPPTQPTVMPAA